MASFKTSLKKVHTADLTGTLGMSVDGLLKHGEHYLVTADGVYYAATPGNHLYFYMRQLGNDYVGASQQRSQITMQHGQANVILGANQGNTTLSTIGYCGDQIEEGMGFKIILNSQGGNGHVSIYGDVAGHVSGTGYRIESFSGWIDNTSHWDGFSVKSSTGGNFGGGTINVYHWNTHESDYIQNV